MSEYDDLASLYKNETRGVHWEKNCSAKDGDVLIVAPHGGSVEPHTELIASAIAKDDFSFFVFRGVRGKVRGRKWLHVTSANFVDPDLTQLQTQTKICVSIHGASNKEGFDSQTTFMGGANHKLRELITWRLESKGFNVFEAPHGIAGNSKANFVNKCGPNQDLPGVQLEISRGERESLADNPVRLERYAAAIREVLLEVMHARVDSNPGSSGQVGKDIDECT